MKTRIYAASAVKGLSMLSGWLWTGSWFEGDIILSRATWSHFIWEGTAPVTQPVTQQTRDIEPMLF